MADSSGCGSPKILRSNAASHRYLHEPSIIPIAGAIDSTETKVTPKALKAPPKASL